MNQDNKAEAAGEGTLRIGGADEGTNTDWRHHFGDKTPAKFSRHIYVDLLANLESQIKSWNRSEVHNPNPEVAHAAWLKAEGLGYALQLLYAFEPEFRELVECASRRKGRGVPMSLPLCLCSLCGASGRRSNQRSGYGPNPWFAEDRPK